VHGLGRPPLLANCVQAHDDCLEVLPHINHFLPLDQTAPSSQVFWSRNSQFFEIPYFQKFFEDQDFFSTNRQKSSILFSGAAPRTPSFTGLLPSLPPRWVQIVCGQWCWITRTMHLAGWRTPTYINNRANKDLNDTVQINGGQSPFFHREMTASQ